MYRLYGLLAVAGLLAVVAALSVVARASTLRVPSDQELIAACSSWLRLHGSPAQLLVLALGSLGLAVIARGAGSAWRAHRAARRFARRLRLCGELAGPPRARLVDREVPQAFCAGLLRPRIYVSTGAVDRLSDAELQAVLAHEAHHAARRDPLRLLVAQVLSDALFFIPAMGRLRRRYAALAELAADEAALGVIGATQPLASAMLTFGELHAALVVGVSEERIDHLSGEPPRWELPVSLLLSAIVTLAAIGALILAAAQAIRPAEISAPALLMQSCGPLMLLVAGLAAVRLWRFAAAR